MAPQPMKLINVRVSMETASAIDQWMSKTGSTTLSDAIRELIERGLGQSATTQQNAMTARHRVDLLTGLADLATLLRRLGNLHAYAIKSRRPADEEESRARVRALESVEAATREILRQ